MDIIPPVETDTLCKLDQSRMTSHFGCMAQICRSTPTPPPITLKFLGFHYNSKAANVERETDQKSSFHSHRSQCHNQRYKNKQLHETQSNWFDNRILITVPFDSNAYDLVKLESSTLRKPETWNNCNLLVTPKTPKIEFSANQKCTSFKLNV